MWLLNGREWYPLGRCECWHLVAAKHGSPPSPGNVRSVTGMVTLEDWVLVLEVGGTSLKVIFDCEENTLMSVERA